MWVRTALLSLLALAPVAFAAFGVQTSGSDMVVDSGDKLVFTGALVFSREGVLYSRCLTCLQSTPRMVT